MTLAAVAAALDRLYAEDFIGIGPSGTVRTKAQVIADFTSGSLRFQSITTDEVRWIHVLAAGVDKFPLELVGDRVLTQTGMLCKITDLGERYARVEIESRPRRFDEGVAHQRS